MVKDRNGNETKRYQPRSPLDEFVDAQDKMDKMSKFFRRISKGKRSNSTDSSDSGSGKLAKTVVKAMVKADAQRLALGASASSSSAHAANANTLMDRLLGHSPSTTDAQTKQEEKMDKFLKQQNEILTEIKDGQKAFEQRMAGSAGKSNAASRKIGDIVLARMRQYRPPTQEKENITPADPFRPPLVQPTQRGS